jgi:vitamin-K-epoxide reductase (warfarin-sensitive)
MQPAVNASPEGSSPETATQGGGNRILFALIAALSFAGVTVSAISLQRHYAKSATELCDISQRFSCDIVNRSEYSSLMGIPVAAIGIAGYAALFVLSTFWKSRVETRNCLFGAAVAGLAFALYLTYVEAYVLATWCILCLISLLLITLISVLAAVIKWKGGRAHAPDQVQAGRHRHD